MLVERAEVGRSDQNLIRRVLRQEDRCRESPSVSADRKIRDLFTDPQVGCETDAQVVEDRRTVLRRFEGHGLGKADHHLLVTGIHRGVRGVLGEFLASDGKGEDPVHSLRGRSAGRVCQGGRCREGPFVFADRNLRAPFQVGPETNAQIDHGLGKADHHLLASGGIGDDRAVGRKCREQQRK